MKMHAYFFFLCVCGSFITSLDNQQLVFIHINFARYLEVVTGTSVTHV